MTRSSFILTALCLATQFSLNGSVPLAFEENRGQTDARVRYLARGGGHVLFLGTEGAVIKLKDGSSVQMSLRDARLPLNPHAVEQVPGVAHYLRTDQRGNITNVRRFAKVRYAGVYPGIDLVYYSKDGSLEYDFVVAPGADPNRIRFHIEGEGAPVLEASGDLLLPGGLRFLKPVLYQDEGNRRLPVEGRFLLEGKDVSFTVAANYRRDLPLVIDPVLSYSTYLGGTSTDAAVGVVSDTAGNAYIAGRTEAADYPTTPGAYRTTKPAGTSALFISKLNPTGTALVYSTYIEGSNIRGLALAPNGDVLVAAESPLAVTAGAYNAGAFRGIRLNAAGTALVHVAGFAHLPQAIATDSAGNSYWTGTATSAITTTAGAYRSTFAGQEAFVIKLNAAGTAAAYATYIGGSGNDAAAALAVDAAGNAYVTGTTTSTNFPTSAGALRISNTGAFVTVLNPTGTGAVFSAQLNASANPQAIAPGPGGNVWIGGIVTAADLPVQAGAVQGAPIGALPNYFLTRLNATGSAVVHSNYLGRWQSLGGFGLAVDQSSQAWIAASIPSRTTTVDAFQRNENIGGDVYLARVNAAGTAIPYATYFGASDVDQPAALSLNSNGYLYMTGSTLSPDLGVTAGALQPTRRGISDSFVVKLDTTNTTACTFTLSPASRSTPNIGASGTFTVTPSNPGCTWTANSDQRWITFHPRSGTGTGTIAYTVYPNYSTSIRSGGITVGDKTFGVTVASTGGTLNERFVRQLYYNFLMRIPSDAEVAANVGFLNAGMSRATLAKAFYDAPEFRPSGRFVAGLYVGLLGRDAEYVGWLFNRNAMATGGFFPNDLVSGFINSNEFQLNHPNISDANYVRLLYQQILLRTPSQSEVDFHVTHMQPPNGSRVNTAVQFLSSNEFNTNSGPRLTAFLLYATLMQRDPTPSELAQRANQVQAGTPLETLFAEFVSSTEFLQTIQ